MRSIKLFSIIGIIATYIVGTLFAFDAAYKFCDTMWVFPWVEGWTNMFTATVIQQCMLGGIIGAFFQLLCICIMRDVKPMKFELAPVKLDIGGIFMQSIKEEMDKKKW